MIVTINIIIMIVAVRHIDVRTVSDLLIAAVLVLSINNDSVFYSTYEAEFIILISGCYSCL